MVNAQAGGLGLHGAFTYIGASAFSYRCAEALGEYRSSRPSRLVSENGQRFVDYDVGLQCRVNGKPGRAWTLSLSTLTRLTIGAVQQQQTERRTA